MKTPLALLLTTLAAFCAAPVTFETVTNKPPAPIVLVVTNSLVVTNTFVVTNTMPADMPVGTVLPVEFTPTGTRMLVSCQTPVNNGLWVLQMETTDALNGSKEWMTHPSFSRDGNVLKLLQVTNSAVPVTKKFRAFRLR